MGSPSLYLRVRALVERACRLLYRVEVVGQERIPRTGPLLLAANHESSIDPALVALVTDRPIRFLARAELWQPGLRRLLDALGGIPIRRGSGDRTAIDAAVEALRRGEVVAIFPQGTVLRFRARRYRRGVARIALAAGAPIVPVRLVGTAKAFSILPPRLGLPNIRVVVGEPIEVAPTRRPTAALVRRLTAQVETAVKTA
jgi:1-acyl-sn-glycerol-3-phosphate acyltransferase